MIVLKVAEWLDYLWFGLEPDSTVRLLRLSRDIASKCQ